MGFVKKFEISRSFYLRQIKPGNILQRKNAFLDYKNKNLIGSKN